MVMMEAPATAASDGQPAAVSTREPLPPPRPLLPYLLARPGVPAQSAKSRTENRAQFLRAVLDTQPYAPIARAEPVEEISPILLTRAQAGPDVLLMPKFEVFADEVDRGLHQAILNYRDPRPINNTRFGTGLRQKDFGKVRAGMVTIFYIPVMIGFSW
jgi:hypothetical protein